MARPTLSSHPKFAKLAARLRSRALARGVLELIWETCYASGDATVGDAETVEAIAGWDGTAGALASALVQTAFIDVRPDANGVQLHVVHDLEDHAPDYVIKRWERESKRRENGLSLRVIRQEAARASWVTRNANGHANNRQMRTSVLPPTPAPAPAPAPSEADPERVPFQARDPGPRRSAHLAAITVPFLAAFDAYPNQNAKQRAAQEFQELATELGGEEKFSVRLLSLFKRGFLRRPPYNGEPRFIPNFATFLAERRFEEKWNTTPLNGVPPEIPDLPPGVPRPERPQS